MDLAAASAISASGMRVQAARLRVVAENLANVDATSRAPGGDPYRRKTISFENALDRELGHDVVRVRRYGADPSAFRVENRPGHPAADADGYVRLPNVNALVELMDMREAQRSYEANLNAMGVARAMRQRTLELLR